MSMNVVLSKLDVGKKAKRLCLRRLRLSISPQHVQYKKGVCLTEAQLSLELVGCTSSLHPHVEHSLPTIAFSKVHWIEWLFVPMDNR